MWSRNRALTWRSFRCFYRNNEANAVFEFMGKLSKLLGKESILTGENCPECVLVTVKSDGNISY
jgi:hypothetical protein